MFVRTLIVIVLFASAFPALAQDEANNPDANWPGYREGDYVVHDYKFVSGENLPEVKLHYRTIGTAKQNAAGEVVNAVLLLQGNAGTGANWFRPTLADELFKPGQPLDPAKYYIIIPDALGRGGSSRPSDGLKGRLAHYRYHEYADGRVFTGSQAVKLGFADSVGTWDDARRTLGQMTGLGDNREVFKVKKQNKLLEFFEASSTSGTSNVSTALRDLFQTELSARPLLLLPGAVQF